MWSAVVLCSAAFVSPFDFLCFTCEKRKTKAAEKHRRTPNSNQSTALI
jgi:hypothetical protein